MHSSDALFKLSKAKVSKPLVLTVIQPESCRNYFVFLLHALTFAEVPNQPTKPFSLQKESSLGTWEAIWSDLLAKSTAGTGLPWLRVTWGKGE